MTKIDISIKILVTNDKGGSVMTDIEMTDVLCEVLAVDTEDGFAVDVVANGNIVEFTTKNGEKFILSIEKK